MTAAWCAKNPMGERCHQCVGCIMADIHGNRKRVQESIGNREQVCKKDREKIHKPEAANRDRDDGIAKKQVRPGEVKVRGDLVGQKCPMYS